MKQRIITALIGSIICIVALIFGGTYPIVIAVAVGIVDMVMVGEFLSAKSLIRNFRISFPCLAFSLIMPIMVNNSLRFLPIYIFTLLLFLMMVADHKNICFNDLAFAYCGTIIITLGMTCFSILAYEPCSIYYILLSLAFSWMADTSAYFVGTFLGKHKLCPNISPKKTVEGAVGGIVGGILGGVVASLVFQFMIYENLQINYLIVIILGFFMTLISILGDLSFSLIKRGCNIKDFGSIMPGHGGLCDRFDSVVFTAPLMMFAVHTFPFVTVNCI